MEKFAQVVESGATELSKGDRVGIFFLFFALAFAQVCLGPGFPELNLERFESELPKPGKSAKDEAVPFSFLEPKQKCEAILAQGPCNGTSSKLHSGHANLLTCIPRQHFLICACHPFEHATTQSNCTLCIN